MTEILIRQVMSMFLLIIVGFVMFKKDKITMEGSKAFGNVLLYLSLPSVIIKSFLVEKTPEILSGIGWSALAAILSLLTAMLLSRFLFRKDGVAAFAGAFSNPGFFGIPLIVASIGDHAVIYVACYIAFLNIFQWSYGVMMLTGKNRNEWKELAFKIIKAPFMAAIVIGFVIFMGNWEVPSLLKEGIGYLANLNTPLAMFVVGIYLTQVRKKELLQNQQLLWISLVRLLVVPFVVCIILSFLGLGNLRELKLAILIASACPVGSNIAVYAQLYECDYAYAVETVVVSTVFSIVTIPLIVQLGNMVL